MAGSQFRSRTWIRQVAPKCGTTVARGWRWKNRIISGSRSSRRSSSHMNRAARERTRWRLKARSRANDCHGRSAKWGSTAFIHARAKQLDGVSDNLPNAGEMLLRSQYVSEPEAHNRSTSQFRLHQVRFAAGVDGLHQLRVAPVRFRVVRPLKPKADHAHHGRC